MKKYPHIILVFCFFLLATTMNAQFMTPPDQTDDFGLEQFLDNGTVNLKNLNPVNFINDKRRRFLEQDWTPQNTWLNSSQEQKLFAANCGLPLQKTQQSFDTLSRAFQLRSLDTFIYVNSRLRTWNTYTVVNGVRTLSDVAQFTYSTRAAPDTVLSISIFQQFADTTRYSYTFNASEQLTAIRQDDKFGSTFIPSQRAQLTYDARGNLTRYLIERPDGLTSNWRPRDDNRYTYNATNQLTEKVNFFTFSSGSIDTSKSLYSYDAQGRFIKLLSIFDGDTTTFTLSNHNAKKRPRTLDFQISDPISPFFGRANLTYQVNDSLIANMITQNKLRAIDPFVNQSRFIFEYCGDAVATQEVKKELLNCLVFPNPASESLTIRMKEETHTNVDVSIVNSTGQVVLQARNQAVNSPVNIATLPNGFYVLKVQSADKIGVTSFTVLK
jgi:Secretion system C-terminal sorting domain